MLDKFEDLVGCTLWSVENRDNEELVFTLRSGAKYSLYHDQDCCESVMIEEIVGDLDNLVGVPILTAEEVINNNETNYDSQTWTFYKISTQKGYVTIRWLGESNGYYSESVDWKRTDKIWR